MTAIFYVFAFLLCGLRREVRRGGGRGGTVSRKAAVVPGCKQWEEGCVVGGYIVGKRKQSLQRVT